MPSESSSGSLRATACQSAIRQCLVRGATTRHDPKRWLGRARADVFRPGYRVCPLQARFRSAREGYHVLILPEGTFSDPHTALIPTDFRVICFHLRGLALWSCLVVLPCGLALWSCLVQGRFIVRYGGGVHMLGAHPGEPFVVRAPIRASRRHRRSRARPLRTGRRRSITTKNGPVASWSCLVPPVVNWTQYSAKAALVRRRSRAMRKRQ